MIRANVNDYDNNNGVSDKVNVRTKSNLKTIFRSFDL